MVFFLLFILMMIAVPCSFIRFFDDISENKPCIRRAILGVILFQLSAVFLSKGSALGANAVFVFGWFTAIAAYCAVCMADESIRKNVKANVLATIIAVAGIVILCYLFGTTYSKYIDVTNMLKLSFGVIALLIVCFVIIRKFYAKYDVFKGFCNMMTLLVFILAGVFGTVAFVSDGICDVMVIFVLKIHNQFLGVSKVVPLVFAVAAGILLISENVNVFMRKLSGYLVALTLIVMVVGEIIKNVAPTNTVMMINNLNEIVTKGGYHQSIIVIISIFADIFRGLGICLVANVIVAFGFSVYNQKKNKTRKNDKKTTVSVEQMRKSDEHTIKNGVSGRELMKRAAQGIYDAVDWNNKKIAIVAGSGNNGGDGYALAEILAENSHSVVVYRVSDKFSDDGKHYFERMETAGVTSVIFTSETELDVFDVVVDCIFGTGFRGVPEGLYKDAIIKINNSGAFVVSADINSGMNGDTGEAVIAVKSNLTVSIGYYKKGMFEGKASELIGELVNVDIGIVLV